MIRISSYIAHLYGKEKAQDIQVVLEKYLETLPKGRYRDEPLWYKSANMYVIYPDAIEGDKTHPLDNVIAFLPHIRETGFSAVHILPFLESPMRDRGFDVSDYYTVRKGLGSMNDIVRLRKEAKRVGLRLFMDLIFNHVSTKHEWFQKALNGDAKYRNYFIHTKEKPEFVRKLYRDAAVWAEYLVKGRKVQVAIVFPEEVGPIPHWIHGKDGYWYYHTFKPEQIDLNWRNPDVFIECAKVLIFWANKGFHFRLDAIPVFGKSAYKQINTRSNVTNHLLAGLNHLAKQVNPECVFILETYEKINTVIRYLGKKNVQQAEMLYGFHVCTALWVSLLDENTQRLWDTLREIGKIPTFGEWVNFLRNHDELSLAYLDKRTLKLVWKMLTPRGKLMREGFGVAGRTFSLLGGNEAHFLMSYMLLASMPGGIMMPYGDEFGKKNTPESYQTEQELKDPRNINRGVISHAYYIKNKNNEIYKIISHMLNLREKIRPYFNVWPEKQESADDIYHAIYTIGNSSLRIIINLSGKDRVLDFSLKGNKKIFSINQIREDDTTLILGPYAGVWLQK